MFVEGDVGEAAQPERTAASRNHGGVTAEKKNRKDREENRTERGTSAESLDYFLGSFRHHRGCGRRVAEGTSSTKSRKNGAMCDGVVVTI